MKILSALRPRPSALSLVLALALTATSSGAIELFEGDILITTRQGIVLVDPDTGVEIVLTPEDKISNLPQGIAMDEDGMLYYVDIAPPGIDPDTGQPFQGGVVRHDPATGLEEWAIQPSPVTPYPNFVPHYKTFSRNIEFDQQGRLLVPDDGGDEDLDALDSDIAINDPPARIQRVDLDQQLIETLVTSGGISEATGLSDILTPHAVAVKSDGDVMIVDAYKWTDRGGGPPARGQGWMLLMDGETHEVSNLCGDFGGFNPADGAHADPDAPFPWHINNIALRSDDEWWLTEVNNLRFFSDGEPGGVQFFWDSYAIYRVTNDDGTCTPEVVSGCALNDWTCQAFDIGTNLVNLPTAVAEESDGHLIITNFTDESQLYPMVVRVDPDAYDPLHPHANQTALTFGGQFLYPSDVLILPEPAAALAQSAALAVLLVLTRRRKR